MFVEFGETVVFVVAFVLAGFADVAVLMGTGLALEHAAPDDGGADDTFLRDEFGGVIVVKALEFD